MNTGRMAAFGLDHATGQVERSESGAGEDQAGEDVPEPPVSVDVVVQHAVGVLVVAVHHRDRQPGAREGRLQIVCRGSEVGTGSHAQHEIVHPTGTPGEVLGGLERREDGREVRLGEQATLVGHDEEVLRAEPGTDVAELPATDVHSARRRQVVERCEVPLEDDDVSIGGAERPAVTLADPDGVDVGTTTGRVDTDDPSRHEHRVAARRRVDLRGEHEPLLRIGDHGRIRELLERSQHRATRCIGSLGGLDPQVVHAEHGEAGVVGLATPRRGAAEAGVHARPDPDDEGDSGDLHPSTAQVTERPPEHEQRTHGATSAVTRSRLALRPAARRSRCAHC